MRKVLKQLQKKPEIVREQIALFSAGGVTLVIVVIWALSLSNPFRTSTVDAETAVAPEKPLQLFFGSLSEGLKEQRQSLKENNPLFVKDESDPVIEEFSVDAEIEDETEITQETVVQEEFDLEEKTVELPESIIAE